MKTLTNFPYNKVLVLGLAKSGEAAAQLLYDSGIDFRINDRLPLEENETAKRFTEMGCDVITGKHPLTVLNDIDLVVKNPGIPYDNPIIQEALNRDLPVITEVELSYPLVEGPLIAITGSNGKTTTTTLIFELLQAGGFNPLIAGNIGNVASEVLREQKKDQPVVMELSSFQLKGTKTFKPDYAILLNLTEAHLDYHHSMEDYINSKLKIFQNQTNEDVAILNQLDSLTSSQQIPGNGKRVYFSVSNDSDSEITLTKDDQIQFRGNKLMSKNEVALPGNHNLENVLASIVIAKSFHISDEIIIEKLRTFIGVKHRLQFLERLNERLFYNDSKATNIQATSKAVRSFERPIVLIAGGLDRGNEFDELFDSFNNVTNCIVYGESKDKLYEAGKRKGFKQITITDSLVEATKKAYELSKPGDIILLSPACASWDQFPSFEARGDMFIETVHKLK
ncbi:MULTISPECIES: UDP-N-acetylmuramoyl-L-alanine--D-glutamate ligase [Allobacillus]|uniref:UDP-N-acetylmuramoylalanine--D-glutamate ligase n=1 Tax=Allobacillus salarius TaxID=1955272 RepID=A0A556PRQ4_9BACI|nr:UDP-N-acetylmuramoyl-L-alanine--D-glutamate ligase [Allobacillus salarius]TSJ67066.1 UDP-N-acetylmuramoyl-L-alanine--D-glutamate ligase [Allobacillus salarius]